jgi:tellurite resistance protein TerC
MTEKNSSLRSTVSGPERCCYWSSSSSTWPAIFGITTDRFIVYTSNIFAILGLRTFFFLLADLADRFHYLKIGLAFVLTFIGVKMLLPLLGEGLLKLTGPGTSGLALFLERYHNHEFEQAVINISLGVVVAAIGLSVLFSILFPRRKHEEAEPDADPLKELP